MTPLIPSYLYKPKLPHVGLYPAPKSTPLNLQKSTSLSTCRRLTSFVPTQSNMSHIPHNPPISKKMLFSSSRSQFSSVSSHVRTISKPECPSLYSSSSSRFYTSRTIQSINIEQEKEIRNLVCRIDDIWKEWKICEDDWEKRKWGVDFLAVLQQLERKITSVSSSSEDFEHYSALYGAPVSENCYKMGLVHEHAGQLDKATEAFARCVELNPSSYQYCTKNAEIHFKTGRYREAIDLYSKILTQFSPLFKKTGEKPKTEHRDSKFSSVLYQHLQLPDKIVYPESKLADNLFLRGKCYFEQAEFQLAMSDWMAITKMEPNHRSAETWTWLARIASMHGKWQQAIDFCTKALEYDPEYLLALEDRQTALVVLKKEDEARKDSKRFAILAHDRIWGLSAHPPLPDWGPESYDENDENLP